MCLRVWQFSSLDINRFESNAFYLTNYFSNFSPSQLLKVVTYLLIVLSINDFETLNLFGNRFLSLRVLER